MFNFHVIDTFQLGKVFGKLKTSKGCGNDGIASCFLKIALPVISESLCVIFSTFQLLLVAFQIAGKLPE